MRASIEQMQREIQHASELLRQPSDADATLRALLADRFYAERQQQAILDWLPKLEQRLDEIVKAYEAELAERDMRIAELEAQAAQPVDMPPAPVLHVVGE